MLYQKLLTEHNAYLLFFNEANDYALHCHPEIEISYCLQGSYTIAVNDKRYCLREGDMVIVNAMAPHEFFRSSDLPAQRLTIELGPSFLGEHFSFVTKLDIDAKMYHLKAHPEDAMLLQLLDRTITLHQNRTDFSELALRGNLYHISSLLLKKLQKTHGPGTSGAATQDILRIEKALRFIYDHYPQPITLDAVCQLCGYSKSHFCRTFKNIVGDTFHNVLNRHRIKIACLHLKESRSPIENIAVAVGFADTKSFCRVFKKIMGISPVSYRKSDTPSME